MKQLVDWFTCKCIHKYTQAFCLGCHLVSMQPRSKKLDGGHRYWSMSTSPWAMDLGTIQLGSCENGYAHKNRYAKIVINRYVKIDTQHLGNRYAPPQNRINRYAEIDTQK